MHDLDETINKDESDSAVASLTNWKIPGLNEVHPEAHKTLDNYNTDYLFNFILKFWNSEIDFEEWNEGKLMLAPKSGDLSNPSK